MLECKINEYITLKLDDDEYDLDFDGNEPQPATKSVVYVNEEPFIQCKRLLISIPVDQVGEYNNLSSIDDIAGKLGWTESGQMMENNMIEYELSPEQEFWGYCSNLQAWVENEYDTRLLHSNIAFPLLKKLTSVGDPIARKVYKDEIILRMQHDYIPTKIYLLEGGFLDNLDNDELNTLFESIDLNFVKDIDHQRSLSLLDKLNRKGYPKVEKLLKEILRKICKSDNTEELILISNSGLLNYLTAEALDILFKNPASCTITQLNLQKSDPFFENMKLQELPSSIDNLTHLEILDISYNNISELPASIKKIKNLKKLIIEGNKINTSDLKYQHKTNFLGYGCLTCNFEWKDKQASKERYVKCPNCNSRKTFYLEKKKIEWES